MLERTWRKLTLKSAVTKGQSIAHSGKLDLSFNFWQIQNWKTVDAGKEFKVTTLLLNKSNYS